MRDGKMKRVKLLIVDIGALKGGIEVFVHNFYNYLNISIDIDFLVFCEKCAWEDEYLLNGSNVYHIPPRRENPFTFNLRINNFFKSHNEFDYVWVQSSSASNISCHKAVKKYTNSKLLTHAHVSKAETRKGIHDFYTRMMHSYNQKKLCKLTDYQLGCSKDALTYLFGDAGNGYVINNGIDVTRYVNASKDKEKNREQIGIEVDSFVLGHVGRFVAIKNHPFIIDVFEQVANKIDNAILVLVGEGEERKVIQNIVNMKMLDDKVVFFGERDEIEKYFSVMDAFIFPSFYEGFGIAVIEAQLAGVKCYINSTLPDNLDVTTNIHRLSLDVTPEKWAEMIVNGQNQNQNIIIDDRVASFDILTSINKFLKIIGI